MNEAEARARFRADVAARVKRDRRHRVVAIDAGVVREDPTGTQVIVYAATDEDVSAYWVSYDMARGQRFERDRVEAHFLAEASAAAAQVRN